jgi:hypothetical protein
LGKGADMQVQIFESRSKREVEARRLAREAGMSYEDFKDSEDFRMGNNIADLRKITAEVSSLLPKLFEAIDKYTPQTESSVGRAKAANEQLKDDIYEMFLAVMPEQSFRKMFIERKGRAGFSTDVLKNIATTASRISPALARLQHSQDARNALSAAKEVAKSQEGLTPYVNETERRLDAALSPKPKMWTDVVAGAGNKLAYLTYLTSAATAFIQPTSMFISALPIISANRRVNPAKVAATLTKNMLYIKQFGVTTKNADGSITYVAPSIVNSKTATEDERAAIQAMIDHEVSTTYAGEMWNMVHGPSVSKEGITAKIGDVADLIVNAPLRNIERLTREITYLTSYQVTRDKLLSQGKTLAEAKAAGIEAAINDTNESLGDYSQAGRPLFMKEGLGKITFAMKLFPLIMAQQLVGNFF